MTNFILGAIFVIALLLLLGYIIDRIEYKRISKELGEDFEYVIMPKSEHEKYIKYMNEEYVENER